MELCGHILVVDDNRLNRLKLSRGLAQQGHTVALAENGRQALEMLDAHAFDVVLLDIVMPEMDGYAVLEAIKSNAQWRNLPVIVISAVDEMESVVRCIEMGAEDYLPKSFDPVLLRARLVNCLEKKKLRDLEQAFLQQELALRQNEKLATLGKLSAGIAHELNNPAAAAARGARQMRAAVDQMQQASARLSANGLSAAQAQALLRLGQLIQERIERPLELDALTRSDREYELENWLDEHGLENAWELAPCLVQLNYTGAGLNGLVQSFAAEQQADVLAWLSSTYTVYTLLDEIGQGAGRIAEIVTALKSYTYMDQAPIQMIDIHEGLDNTLIMLRSKLRAGVEVQREYSADLPRIQVYGSELNQVWTNIIDNAISAMDGQGRLILRTRREGTWIVVEIEDTGPGIPEAIQPKIFDPFFTTKPPGQGTGLGLNISHNTVVHKHKGEMSVESRPGKTCFRVKVPIQLEAPPTMAVSREKSLDAGRNG